MDGQGLKPQLDDEDLLTMPEVAEMARMPLQSLRYIRKSGDGPEGFPLGKRIVFRKRKVREWIAEIEAAAPRKRGAA